MSRSEALIRFKKTGNIYYGCNDNCSDTMMPNIVNTESLKIYPGFDYFSYREENEKTKNEYLTDKLSKSNDEVDEVEIYIYDYNSCYSGIGSEKYSLILFDNNRTQILNSKPQWVIDFDNLVSEKEDIYFEADIDTTLNSIEYDVLEEMLDSNICKCGCFLNRRNNIMSDEEPYNCSVCVIRDVIRKLNKKLLGKNIKNEHTL